MLRIIILIFIISTNVWAANAPLNVTDGVNSCYPYKMIVSSNSCSNGVATISSGGSSSFWVASPGNIGINTTQNVGIGTSTPSDYLNVVSSTSGGLTIGSMAGGVGGIDSFAKLMLHNDDTALSDSSLSPYTTTLVGSVSRSSAQSVFGGFSALFTGSTDAINLSDSNDWYMSGDFTVDWRQRFTSISGVQVMLAQIQNGSNYMNLFFNGSTSQIVWNIVSSGTSLLQFHVSWSPSNNTWYAIAFQRSGNTWTIRINGTALSNVLDSGSYSATLPNLSAVLQIGNDAAGDPFLGYIDEFRWTNGMARYASDYTPAVSAYTSVNATPQITFNLPVTPTQTGFIKTDGNDSNKLKIGQGSTTAITIDSNENVGIGTTIPQAGFSVMNGNVGIGTWIPATLFEVGKRNFDITSSGNIGIGSITPGQLLDVAGIARFQNIVNTGVAANSLPYSNGSQQLAASTIGTSLALSAGTLSSNAVSFVSYQPGLLSAVNATIGVNYKFSKASTVDNLIGSAVTFSCVGNPTVTMYECGTSTTCSGPTTIGTVTVTAAGTLVVGTVSNPAITAGDYIGWAITSGTCASIDIAATAQVHSN